MGGWLFLLKQLTFYLVIKINRQSLNKIKKRLLESIMFQLSITKFNRNIFTFKLTKLNSGYEINLIAKMIKSRMCFCEIPKKLKIRYNSSCQKE